LRFDIAFGEACGARGMGLCSRELAERAAASPSFVSAIAAASGGRVLLLSNGEIVGAVGISGDTSDNDEIWALAGIEASGFVA
jgi:uncharacterized protein GlcG (DUF336 family)